MSRFIRRSPRDRTRSIATEAAKRLRPPMALPLVKNGAAIWSTTVVAPRREIAVMTDLLTTEGRVDLLDRGFSRRQVLQIATIFSVGAAAASVGRPAWASAGIPDPAPSAKVRIGANECWTGPLSPGQAGAAAIISSSNRYSPKDERGDFVNAVMQVEGVPSDHVAPWPGSSDPLSRSVVTFTSPARGLVTADPTFELAGRPAHG